VAKTLGSLVGGPKTGFVGRESELRLLRCLLEEDAAPILFVSGIGGVGKSALLDAFAVGAGVPVVKVDGEAIEPTERGFLRALSGALEVPDASLEDALARLGAMRPTVVVAIDGYERLQLLDDWLRRVFVPSLPVQARVVLCGRDAPLPAWMRLYGSLVRSFVLDSMPPPDAHALLAQLGVSDHDAVAVNRVLRGHPLSLRLAAASPSALAAAGAGPALDELARTYLRDLPPLAREALDAASLVRRVTLGLLEAMLGADAAPAALDRLRALDFVTAGPDGLIVNHVLQAAVAAELAAHDRPRHRRLRADAWRRLRDELAQAPDDDLWRYTADMLYLLERPAIRDAFFPPSAPMHSVEPAQPEDATAIATIAERHEPRSGAALQRAWWEAAPEAFFVARDRDGAVASYSAVCEPRAVGARLVDHDPIARTWREHLRAHPLARGERALFIRFMCGAESGERPAADVAPLFLDLKRTYLTLRPALRVIFTCAHDPLMAETLLPLGFQPLDRQPLLDGVGYSCFVNDFGPGSVDGWLARLAARDVLSGRSAVLDRETRQLTIDGRSITLTELEFGVVAALEARSGTVVRREQLVREVWGGSWAGEGNALEAVVSGVRRKLGARAAALETVRGVGYLLRPLW
jgi:hypothetical protein